MLLNELKQPQSYKPTEHERIALAIVISSDTPQMADIQLSNNAKLAYSRDKLLDLGFITKDLENGITLTDIGMQLAQAQALSDSTGATSVASEVAASISN